MRLKSSFLILVIILLVSSIVGCQQQADDVASDSIKMIDETEKQNDGIEEEFGDNLDAALEELEEIDNI